MKHPVTFVAALVFGFAALVPGCTQALSEPPQSTIEAVAASPGSITGRFQVTFKYRTSPTSTSGGARAATRIDFYESYVVMHNEDRTGQLFPLRLIEEFRWETEK